jgi:hypothetical protein
MIFHDAEVDALDLTTPIGVQKLTEVYLCGHNEVSELSPSDQQLLQEFVDKALPAGVTFQQFNELLLVLNQDRVSAAFFNFFFQDGVKPLTVGQLRQGVIRFKGFAMVCFGNFRFAFRRLSAIVNPAELREQLGPCCRTPDNVESLYAARANKVLDVSLIPRDNTWFVGEITGRMVGDELKKFEEYRRAHPEISEDDRAVNFAKRLVEMDATFTSVQDIALRNTDVYLTWDHLDIYVATSMRNRWEYEEVFDFTQALFSHPELTPLKLRHFDPTQSKCRTSRDKGLLEGLMLKRAYCTIYMAQETDTLGKDSELANTLAQGKPVIAYVPTITPNEYASIIEKRPLRYAKLRLLDLQASGIVEGVDGLARLTQSFLDDLAEHRKRQPFELWAEQDTISFKQAKAYWPTLCRALAEAERQAFNRRALVLQKYHPLGMQINLKSGVANGVLVVRSIDKCAELLRAILTNRAEFDIQVDEGGRILVERISTSVFRTVTDNEKLTNSFWNFWNA